MLISVLGPPKRSVQTTAMGLRPSNMSPFHPTLQSNLMFEELEEPCLICLMGKVEGLETTTLFLVQRKTLSGLQLKATESHLWDCVFTVFYYICSNFFPSLFLFSSPVLAFIVIVFVIPLIPTLFSYSAIMNYY